MTATADIEARYNGRLGDFSLRVYFRTPMRGITGLFGASGSGKTTILRCIAGLHRLSGRFAIGDDVWQDDDANVFRPSHDRPIGYVFQEASLFPHLSVRDNLLYGYRRAVRGGAAVEIRFDDIVSLLGLSALLERAPANLSGGERQRVAVGRALLAQPKLMLMDEPLSALDRASKDEILPYFEALRENLSLPILYVSHDIAEIERLADTLVLLERGQVLASGSLAELEADTALPLARLPEAAVVLDGTISEIDAGFGLTTLSVPGGRVTVPGRHGSPGARRRLRIRASDISLTLSPAADTTIVNILPARIVSLDAYDPQGVQMNIVLRLGGDGSGARLIARVTRRSQQRLNLTPDSAVFVQIKSVAVVASGADRAP